MDNIALCSLDPNHRLLLCRVLTRVSNQNNCWAPSSYQAVGTEDLVKDGVCRKNIQSAENIIQDEKFGARIDGSRGGLSLSA